MNQTLEILKKSAFIILIPLIWISCTSKSIAELEDDIEIPQSVYYTPNIETIIDNHCISCHRGAGASGGVSLETYNDVRSQTENGKLLIRINDLDNPMPPQGLIPEVLRENFQQWSESNYQQSEP
jgi:mono/diheme cytochrome c family protein